MEKVVIIKLGGSVITKKSEGKKEINEETLLRISNEISEAKKFDPHLKLVIVHGAGPFGHVPAKKYGLNKGLKGAKQVVGMAITHQSMQNLNYQVVYSLQENGLTAISFQPSSSGVLKEKKLISFNLEPLEKFIEIGLIPVLYGDVLIDTKTGLNILSGDHLVPYLAEKLKAGKVVMCTDVDGIFTKDPKVNDDAKLIQVLTKDNINYVKEFGSSKSTDVTGGMQRKAEELFSLSEKFDTNIEIINGFREGFLKRTLLEETGLGTTIKKN